MRAKAVVPDSETSGFIMFFSLVYFNCLIGIAAWNSCSGVVWGVVV